MNKTGEAAWHLARLGMEFARVMPWMMSITAAALRRAVQRLMSSVSWLMRDLLSCADSARGCPPRTPASCRQLDHARCVFALCCQIPTLCESSYSLSSSSGGRSSGPELQILNGLACSTLLLARGFIWLACTFILSPPQNHYIQKNHLMLYRK